MTEIPSAIPLLILAMFVICGLVRLAEQEYRDAAFANLMRKYMGLRPFEKILTGLFVAVFCISGGSKPTNSVQQQIEYEILTNTAVIAETAESELTGSGAQTYLMQNQAARLSSNQYAAGFALLPRAVTNAAQWLSVPSNAVAHGPWARYGLAEDTFWLPATNWAFVLGTNAVEGAHVSSSGTLSFDPGTPKGSPRARGLPDGDTLSFLAPLQASLGTVPPEGRFWHAVTPSNSVLMTWQHLFAGRDTNSPVTFQAELFSGGDFVYRYAFTNALALTNFVVGAQHNLGGETYSFSDTNALVNGLELRWRWFGNLDPNVEDHDGDGVSTYDEVMTYGSNPSLKDSDSDGLEDAAEIAAGTDPLDPDTDRDDLPDGADPQPAVWNDPDGDAGGDGLGYLYEVMHGLDPAADNSLDTDGDGWADWKERMAGTSTNDNGSLPVGGDNVPALFDATFTLAADQPCAVLLSVGNRTLVLRQAGSVKLTLTEGTAHPVSVLAARPCTISLSVSLSSAFAALQAEGGVFTGGAAVPGGAAVACGVIAQPTLGIEPERVCFHSEAPKTVAAKVSPPMAGSYQWSWYGGGISSASGRSANISWEGGDSYVHLSFTAEGAAQARSSYREVTKCQKVDVDTWCDSHSCEQWYCACDNAGASEGDDCGFHGQKVFACRAAVCPEHNCPYAECPEDWCHQHGTWYSDCGLDWCHWHGCYYTECAHEWYDPDAGGGSGGNAEEEEPEPDPGEPAFGACYVELATVNNDDDDASAADDSGEAPVAGENDLAGVWPLGYFDGQCCPCPKHHVPPDGSESAELESCSARLELWADAAKTTAFGDTVNAGHAVWVEGRTASSSVGADRIVWRWTDENDLVHRVTNAFTVLSVRLFGDVNLDGQVDAADKALHPGLSHETGWAMPAATNVFRPVRLRTDVGLSGGAFTLALSGDAGIRVWPDASGTNAEPLLVCGQTVTNGAGGVSFLAGADTDLYVEAVSNGTATLTYAYQGIGDAAGISCAASMKMTAYRVTLEPVTVEANGQGTIVNPCGVAANGLAAYRVQVEPSADIPDSAIHWSVASGGVTIYGGHDIGREVIVRGGASESDFKLEVEVDEIPLAVNPYIHGRVLEPKTVPVRAYIICTNGVPAVSTSTINDWIDEANRVYRQVAVTFTLAGVSTVENQDWLEIGDDAEFYQMTSCTNGTGGLELYCVSYIISGAINGLHSDRQLPYGDARRGMAVRADAPLRTFAHESGHACGLPDLYAYGVVAGLVSEDKVKPLNWSGGDGTGYYPSGLLYRDVMFRSLMHNHDGTDIPLDYLTGIDGGIPVSVSAGLNQMSTREPQH